MVGGWWLLVVSCWSLVVGWWLLVVGCWLLVVVCCGRFSNLLTVSVDMRCREMDDQNGDPTIRLFGLVH